MRSWCNSFVLVIVVIGLVQSISLAHVLDDSRKNSVTVDHMVSPIHSGRRGGETKNKLSIRQFHHLDTNKDRDHVELNFDNRRTERLTDIAPEPLNVLAVVKNLSPRSEEELPKRTLEDTVSMASEKFKEIPLHGILPANILKRRHGWAKESRQPRVGSKPKTRRMVYGWMNSGFDGSNLFGLSTSQAIEDVFGKPRNRRRL